MLQTALGTLTGFFSRTFIVGHFFPALIAVVVNGFFVALASKGLQGSLGYLRGDLKVGDMATVVGIAALLAAALAFSLAPMIQAFRRALEGDVLFGWLRKTMIKQRKKVSEPVIVSRDGARIYAAQVAALQEQSVDRFAKAIRLGSRSTVQLGEAGVKAAEDAVAAARRAVQQVSDDWLSADYKPARGDAATAALKHAVGAVEAALRRKGTAQGAVAERRQKAHEALVALLLAAVATARSILVGLEGRIDTYMLSEDPQPTRLGNLTAELHAHCRTVYGAGFEYLWPRIRTVQADQGDKFEPVEQAQTQLTFALGMLLLELLSGAAWLAWLAWHHNRPFAIAAAGAGVPLLAVFFYRVVLESQRTLIEAIKAAIDRYRFQLLDALHVAKPADYAAEVQTWKTLEQMASGYLSGGGNLSFEHPKP